MGHDDVPARLLLVAAARAGEGAELVRQIALAVESVPLATLVLEPDPAAPMPAPELAGTVQAIQALGIATLLSADATLARVVKADGVHLPASRSIMAAYREARETLGARFIVGADVGRTRHDAMTLGEEGADYIAFGIPAHVEDRATARDRRRDLIAWWAEIFEPPCVAFDVETPQEARELLEAGADFIAVRSPTGLPADRLAGFLAGFAAPLLDRAAAT
jgi:thiamine-phosphate pyrophosphorylase